MKKVIPNVLSKMIGGALGMSFAFVLSTLIPSSIYLVSKSFAAKSEITCQKEKCLNKAKPYYDKESKEYNVDTALLYLI